jgi:hypothetical protein
MRRNTYKATMSISARVIEQLKDVRFDSKSVLLGMTMAAVASGAAPGVFASFSNTSAYKDAVAEVATDEMKTSAYFFAARYGLLPEDFNLWGMADSSGWTVAHEAALYGHLPTDFEHLDIADRAGRTVAQVMKDRDSNRRLVEDMKGNDKASLSMRPSGCG